jgi:predicted porin
MRQQHPAALAGAVLLLSAAAVQAQSSVTIYGLIDLAAGKYDATKDKTLGTGATSFLGIRGVEDLGDGLRAQFQLEHQINPDTGTQYNSSAFWSGRATVGLEGRWGRVNLGRDVNATHYAEVLSDPFGQNGLPSGYGARGGISRANGAPGLIETVRTSNSINYAYTAGSITLRAQTAAREGSDPDGNVPYGVSLVYANGPWQVGVSHINPAKVNDQWSYVAGNYDFGPVRLYVGLGGGKNTFSQAMRNQILGFSAPIGPGSLMGTVSRTTSEGTTIQTRPSVGYYHSLSKRTTIYADVVYDSKAGAYVYGADGWAATGTTLSKTGYDMGLRHRF